MVKVSKVDCCFEPVGFADAVEMTEVAAAVAVQSLVALTAGISFPDEQLTQTSCLDSVQILAPELR